MKDRKIPVLVGPDGKTPASMKNILTKQQIKANAPCTELRAAELIEAGVIAGLKNIVEHFEEANTAHMEQMEDMVTQRVMSELERRSVRGRIRRAWRDSAVRGFLSEVGAVSPIDQPKLEVQS